MYHGQKQFYIYSATSCCEYIIALYCFTIKGFSKTLLVSFTVFMFYILRFYIVLLLFTCQMKQLYVGEILYECLFLQPKAFKVLVDSCL